jgi:dynein heavy chain
MCALVTQLCLFFSYAQACFDEFNRIDVEVLSVIAQQILTIQQAVAAQKSRFEFEGRTIALVPTCGVFITMNPNYAGRQELPDNLKALFRPIAMMVPDYGLIAQISLFSQGFQTAFKLSAKMVQLYKLSSEQLSKQFHYDFGMRAVKSVLDMAGALKRNAPPDMAEDVLLIRAMRDANIPKFLAPDLPLFERIVQDLFPGVKVEPAKHAVLRAAIEHELRASNLQPVKAFVDKIVQVHETMMVRHGVMCVGPTATGKTTAYTILARALTAISKQPLAPGTAPNPVTDPFFREVVYDIFNPKAISMDEMYGKLHPVTNDWVDGLVGFLVRKACDNRTPTRKWIVYDGPVDAIWIENLNTVLDDSKCLCLANGERIKIPNDVTQLFEVEDLSQASLATISRNGMVCLEAVHLGWLPILESWGESIRTRLLPPHFSNVMNLLRTKIDVLLGFVHAQPHCGIAPVDNNLVRSCLGLFESLLFPPSPTATAAAAAQAAAAAAEAKVAASGNDPAAVAAAAAATAAALAASQAAAAAPSRLSEYSEEDLTRVINSYLFLSVVWSFGATLSAEQSRVAFNMFVRQQLGPQLAPKLPSEGQVYDYWLDADTVQFVHWDKRVAPFTYDIRTPYFNLLVPTADTTKFTFLLNTLLAKNNNVLFIGETGVGKSVIVQEFMNAAARAHPTAPAAGAATTAGSAGASAGAAAAGGAATPGSGGYYGLPIVFSGQTSADNLKELLESKLEKKARALGAPSGHSKVVLFVDDLNMPKCEQYGAQPPIELLRQCIDGGGFWDRKKKKPMFRLVQDIVYVAACAPPGGGRQRVTPRLMRHYHQLWQPIVSDSAMRTIFTSILGGFLNVVAAHFSAEHKIDQIAASLVECSIGVYAAVQQRFLPAPATSHYTFNLRDLSKVIQGMTQIQREALPNLEVLVKLWVHESSRVFRDRLVDDADRGFFDNLLAGKVKATFGYDWKAASFRDRLFGDYVNLDERQYQEVKNEEKLVDLLKEYLEEYNNESPQPMDLVFFRDAISHLSRVARILRQPRGNALLVGVGGSGRASLTRLAAHMCDYKLFQIEITRNFNDEQWRNSLKKLLSMAGPLNQPVVFLFSDSQVLSESYLENINNLLNAGEVPNLFEQDEVEDIISRVRPLAKVAGKPETKEGVLSHFVQMVRENLHVVLCFSPIGDAFRYRCRQYPSFVNCCTIDWYNAWPEQALLSVADRALTLGPNLNAMGGNNPTAAPNKDGPPPPSFLVSLGMGQYKDALCKMCVRIHNSVSDLSTRYLKELRRHNYTTPTSYLELIRMFTKMLTDEREKVTRKIDRYRNGLKRLVSTNKLVEELRTDLITLQPELTKAAAATAELVAKLSKEKKELDEKSAVFAKDVAATKEATEKVQTIRDSCEADLKEALPEYLEAIKALNTIKKEHITVLKSFREPPAALEKIMNAVCLLFVSTTFRVL